MIYEGDMLIFRNSREIFIRCRFSLTFFYIPAATSIFNTADVDIRMIGGNDISYEVTILRQHLRKDHELGGKTWTHS